MTILDTFTHPDWKSVYKRLGHEPIKMYRLNILEDSYCVSLLLTSPHVDPAIEENWPIRSACARGFTETVRVLLLE